MVFVVHIRGQVFYLLGFEEASPIIDYLTETFGVTSWYQSNTFQEWVGRLEDGSYVLVVQKKEHSHYITRLEQIEEYAND